MRFCIPYDPVPIFLPDCISCHFVPNFPRQTHWTLPHNPLNHCSFFSLSFHLYVYICFTVCLFLPLRKNRFQQSWGEQRTLVSFWVSCWYCSIKLFHPPRLQGPSLSVITERWQPPPRMFVKVKVTKQAWCLAQSSFKNDSWIWDEDKGHYASIEEDILESQECFVKKGRLQFLFERRVDSEQSQLRERGWIEPCSFSVF